MDDRNMTAGTCIFQSSAIMAGLSPMAGTCLRQISGRQFLLLIPCLFLIDIENCHCCKYEH